MMKDAILSSVLFLIFVWCAGCNAVGIPARCDALANQEDCPDRCYFEEGAPEVFLVKGTGEDCEVISREASACFDVAIYEDNNTIRERYRHELEDGTALIVNSWAGVPSKGWVEDGQLGSTSCPTIDDELTPY